MKKKTGKSGSERDVMRIEHDTLCRRVYELEEEAFRQEALLADLCEAIRHLTRMVLEPKSSRRSVRNGGRKLNPGGR